MKIAVLVTEYLNEYLKQSIAKLNLYCKTEIFIYYNYKHIVELYKMIEDKFDGFITTGPGPFQAIHSSKSSHKPLGFFLCSESNYYKTFFEVIYKYQDWNFEYGYFDFCDYLCTDNEKSLIPYLKNGNFKEWLDKNNNYISQMALEEVQKALISKKEKHISLWKEGKIKYSLSRMSPIMPELLENGVNCYYIPPSLEDIRNGFEKLIQQILINELKNNQIACINIVLSPKEDFIEEKISMLKKIVTAFFKKNLCNYIFADSKIGVKIITSYKALEKLTNSFSNCLLGKYIRENSNLNIFIGYGIAKEISQAEFNSENAIKEAKLKKSNTSYLINENQDLIGLFEQDSKYTIENENSLYVRELSNMTGLSILTIQKLISALKIIGSKEITSLELAKILHISLRSSNRIISSLLKYNLVKILYSKQLNTKGRPSNVYEFLINLNK